jgi:hypothetical protein
MENNLQEKYLFATGYPIGFYSRNDNEYYNIQLNREVYPVNLLSAYIWMESLKGGLTKIKTMDNVISSLMDKGYELGQHYTIEDLEYCYEALVDKKLIVELGIEDIEEFLLIYPDIRYVRCGFGTGITDNVTEVYSEGKSVEVTNLEYYIWQMGTETTTLLDAYRSYKETVMYEVSKMDMRESIDPVTIEVQFVFAFLELFQKDLIYITEI